tara:strand:+ start:732 stop:989 length:258 start_codon:yes stop_codon:yes gene_type:complete
MSDYQLPNDFEYRRADPKADYVAQAKIDDPGGITCSFCASVNTFADDLGWFFIHPDGDVGGYACKACYHGEPGQKHQARYGVGDR